MKLFAHIVPSFWFVYFVEGVSCYILFHNRIAKVGSRPFHYHMLARYFILSTFIRLEVPPL
jgi:hypothetical protein